MRLKRFVTISKNGKKKLVFFLLFLFFFLGLFLLVNSFYIKEIVLISSDPKVRLIGISGLKNTNILFLNSSQVEKEIIEKNPYVYSIEIIKKYPSKLILEVIMDSALAMIKCDSGYFLVSEKGKIIKKQKQVEKHLPQINYYQKVYFVNYQAGQTIEYQEIISVLKLLKEMKGIGMEVVSVDIIGTHMVAFNLEEKQIFFSLEKDLFDQEYQLETIVHQFKIEGKEFTSLDLRFNKPVIKLK